MGPFSLEVSYINSYDALQTEKYINSAYFNSLDSARHNFRSFMKSNLGHYRNVIGTIYFNSAVVDRFTL